MKKSLAFKVLTQERTSALLVLIVLLTSVFAGAPASAEDKISVMVSILPQVWFVEQIGGNEVTVEALVGPGHSPATFEPTARQMARLQDASAYFSSGVPFERGLLPRIANSQNFPPVFGPRPEGSVNHQHDHSDGLDPHIWLDPALAMAMVDTIGRVLAELSPPQEELFLSRTAELKKHLRALREEIITILAPVKGQTFYVFHPAYGHFAQAFGLHQIAVENHGHEPGPRQLAEVIDKIQADQAQTLIVQPQFSKKSAQAIANSTGVELLVLDPLAIKYDANLLFIARSLAATLSEKEK